MRARPAGNGNNNPSPPSATDEDLLCTAIIAMATGVVGATLYQVPNAPIVFTSDPKVRVGASVCVWATRVWDTRVWATRVWGTRVRGTRV